MLQPGEVVELSDAQFIACADKFEKGDALSDGPSSAELRAMADAKEKEEQEVAAKAKAEALAKAKAAEQAALCRQGRRGQGRQGRSRQTRKGKPWRGRRSQPSGSSLAIISRSAMSILFAHISAANTLVTAELGTSGLSDTHLAEIEKYVAAHLATVADLPPGVVEQTVDRDEEIFSKAEGLKKTHFGETAIMLDSTGTLSQDRRAAGQPDGDVMVRTPRKANRRRIRKQGRDVVLIRKPTAERVAGQPWRGKVAVGDPDRTTVRAQFKDYRSSEVDGRTIRKNRPALSDRARRSR